MNLPALVLAAGFGSRLAGYANLPKPLVHFRERRLIEWNLVWLAAHGIRRTWINLHREPAAFRSILGDGAAYGLEISYSEEEEILGTAGAWRRLRHAWSGASLIVYGDNVMRFDLRRLHEAHERNRAEGASCTIALFDPAIHANTGIAGSRVALGTGGAVLGFREGASDTSGWVSAGVYIAEPDVADRIGDGFQDFGRDVFPLLASAGALRAHLMEPTGFCLGLDTPECFAAAERLADEGRVRL